MDCSKARNLISAYADGELNAKQKELMLSHISTCVKCSAKYNEIIKISILLKSSPDVKAPSDFLSKLHSRMEEENLIEQKESVLKIIFNMINRPMVLRPAAALILSVIIIAVYRPHEFLSENFKKSDSTGIAVKQEKYSAAKQDQNAYKPAAPVKREKPAKQKTADETLKFPESNKEFYEMEKDDASPSPPVSEKKEDKKVLESEIFSTSEKNKSGMGRGSYEEKSPGENLKRKSRAESYDKSALDSVAKLSNQSIDSIIAKYNGKILSRDNIKISISLHSGKSAEFFNEISSRVINYTITGKNNEMIIIDLFMKK